ncbi:branched-chain amino acid ABC transporter permease [Solirubrobacter sp. CPCC 204708]|uniref:Branched-chain amino acid ABC transporter permease n=1 Tax=Solirubrobacter deserti TaxID=2282478 RepID=A0ABT4RSZ8_9ACTN|nr:branched-chain amino acid ABC transporter permease [Solirubrobacter deserti]MBE2320365.1 branched-chain amino acid ABC transporter permease [Solirubrobacter deserti]MDA0141717.1 branched-chain amino acid ABC transporter permease [Solirubrobacter deserti]
MNQFVTVTLNGLTLAALYFVVASGFTLIFGLMRVVNMAHGALYLLGGYIALEIQTRWFEDEGSGLGLSLSGASDTEYSVFAWFVPLVLATLIIGVLGVVLQQVFLRWNQGQDLRQALITIALSVILADQMLAYWGGISKDIAAPSAWPTSITLPGDVRFGFFRGVVVLAAALIIGLGLYLIIKRTRFGKIVRAGVDDRDMVSALGINVNRVFIGMFFLGAMLAGIGGVLGGTMISLAPGQDTAFLLNSLIVVIIGGMGSLGGAAIGALALGLVDAYADVYLVFGDVDLTNYSIIVTFALLVGVLAVRPLGLFGRPA